MDRFLLFQTKMKIKELTTQLIFILISIPCVLLAQSEPSLNWQFGSFGSDLGEAGILIDDIDNNGFKEIVFSGRDSGEYYDYFGTFHITILEYNEGENSYKIKRVSNNYSAQITSLQLLDFDQDGSKDIYAGFADGTVRILNSITLDERLILDTSGRGKPSAFDPPNKVGNIVSADYDNSGDEKLLVTNGDTTYVYNNNYRLIGKFPYGAKFLRVGNIDGDPQSELIYSNGQILQFLDGEFILEYNIQKSGHEVPIEIADLNQDGVLDIIYSSDDLIFVKDMKSNQMIWSSKWYSDYFYNEDITSLWIYDFNNDGILDIIIGNEFSDAIYFYNGINGHKDFSIRDYPNNGIASLAIANLDGDANNELIWSVGANSTDSDFFFIYDLSTKQKKWQSKNLVSDFSAFDIGDRDNDGKIEIISAATEEYPNYNARGIISVFSGATKLLEWQNNEAIAFAYSEGYSAVKIADIDNDDENELIIGIQNRNSSSRVYVFDDDYSIKNTYEIDGMNIIIDIEVSDIDNDGTKEVIVTSGTNVGGSSHPEDWQNFIYIFDGITAEIEWKSPQIGSVSSTVGNIKVGNIDNDNAQEVAVIKYFNGSANQSVLYIIDGENHSFIEKEIDVNAIDIADIDKDGIDEIVVGTNTGAINFYNGLTFEVESSIDLKAKKINAIEVVDFNNDGFWELAVISSGRLLIYDLENSRIKWRSKVINSNVGKYGSLMISDMDNDNNIDITFNANHALYNYEIENYEFLTNNPEVETRVFYIEEHSAIGSLVGKIDAIDINNEELTYELMSHESLFSIEATTGNIFVADSVNLDFETNPSIRIEVKVRNNYGGSSIANVILHLLDVKENEITTSTNNPDESNILVYPNPTSGIIQIKSRTNCYSIITDLSGSNLLESKDQELNLTFLPNGVYIISLYDRYGRLLTRTRIIRN